MSDKIAIKAIYPTSYTHIKAFEQCPKQFYHVRHLDSYPFVETEEIKYGNALHKAAENYVRDDLSLPPRFAFIKSTLDALKKKPGTKYCEIKLGITEELVPCTFFSKQVWIRGAIDLLIIDGNKATVIDYKTSKNAKYADKDQLELMALLVFAHYPEVEHVNAGLVFVKCNELIKDKYAKIDRSTLWADWIRRHAKMVEAHKKNSWPTRESGLCRKHCPVTECVHNGANS